MKRAPGINLEENARTEGFFVGGQAPTDRATSRAVARLEELIHYAKTEVPRATRYLYKQA